MYIKAENRNIHKNNNNNIENSGSFNNNYPVPSYSNVIGNNNNNNSSKFLQNISSETKLPLKTDKLNNNNNNNIYLSPGIISTQHFDSISNSHSNLTSPFITPSNSNRSSFSSSSLSPHQNNTKEIYSLKFLHKPQRVKQFNSDRIPEEILQRNTDLNKQITLDIPPLSPKSNLPTDQLSSNYIDFNYPSNDSSESFLNQNTPIYKKSGELVKSSLKRRSKSLPSTSAAAAAAAAVDAVKGSNPNDPNKPVLLRSKSVHFDQRAPVRYFISDESPMNVYSKDEFEDKLKFNLLRKAKKLGQIAKFHNDSDDEDNESAEEELLLNFKNLLLEEKRKLLQKDPRFVKELIENEKTTVKTPNGKEKQLRKSKRFQGIASKQKNQNQQNDTNNNNVNVNVNNAKSIVPKRIDIDSILNSKINKIPSETKIAADYDMSKNDDSSATTTNHSVKEIIKTKSKNKIVNKMKTNRVVGLYNQNFPVLSNKNPYSLKLNIFVSLSQDKKVFLQELSLHIHQKNFVSPNFKGIGPVTNTTRYIIGKVMVKNIYYDKRVTIRYTWNNWNTFNEVECLWLSNGDSVLPGTNMDVFHFLIDDTNKIDTIGKLEFCICYVTRNDRDRLEFWDNNDGNNYKVDVVMSGFNNPFTL